MGYQINKFKPNFEIIILYSPCSTFFNILGKYENICCIISMWLIITWRLLSTSNKIIILQVDFFALNCFGGFTSIFFYPLYRYFDSRVTALTKGYNMEKNLFKLSLHKSRKCLPLKALKSPLFINGLSILELCVYIIFMSKWFCKPLLISRVLFNVFKKFAINMRNTFH